MNDAGIGAIFMCMAIAVGAGVYYVAKDNAVREITKECERNMSFYYGDARYICAPPEGIRREARTYQ